MFTFFTLVTLRTLSAGFTLRTLWTLWTCFALRTTFTIFDNSLGYWILTCISRTVSLGWVELDGGFFLSFVAAYNRNERFTIFALGTLSTCCAGSTSFTLSTVFTVFNDTSCDRVFSRVSRTVSFSWVELNSSFFLSFIAVNDWNEGFAVFALFTLGALWSGYAWITFVTFWTLRTGYALFALFTTWTYCTRFTLIAFWSSDTRFTFVTLSTGLTFRPLLAIINKGFVKSSSTYWIDYSNPCSWTAIFSSTFGCNLRSTSITGNDGLAWATSAIAVTYNSGDCFSFFQWRNIRNLKFTIRIGTCLVSFITN